jgi:hypothetical protein
VGLDGGIVRRPCGGGSVEAAKADILSLTAVEVSLFGWMALITSVFFVLTRIYTLTAVYWFLMEFCVIIGFATRVTR